MNEEKFFYKAWIKYYKTTLTLTVPNNCHYDNNISQMNVNQMDESLRHIIQNQTIRIGIHKRGAAYPTLYSVITTPTNSTTSKTINNNDSNNSEMNNFIENTTTAIMTHTTDLDINTLDGYEIHCAKYAIERLSEMYQTTIQIDWILLTGDLMFDDFVPALNNNIIDMFWSTIIPTQERDNVVDFVCNTFMTEWVIGASSKVGNIPPDFHTNSTSYHADDEQIHVACTGYPCNNFIPPYPFIFDNMISASNVYAPLVSLGNTSDEYEYCISSFELLDSYILESCNNCVYLNIQRINVTFRSPGTKFFTKQINQTQQQMTSSSSNRIMKYYMTSHHYYYYYYLTTIIISSSIYRFIITIFL